MRILSVLLAAASMCAQVPVIVDTDAGADDLIALLWLTRQNGVKIEAVTISSGLAHPNEGAGTVLRLLEAAGLRTVPVYVGPDRPVQGTSAFPDSWRKSSDALLRDELPVPSLRPARLDAPHYLAARLLDRRKPVRILALGPLTNLGRAVALEPRTGSAVTELIWMGGALTVPGNVPQTPSAEWNVWVDPEAAERVIAMGWRIRIVPLDVTNRVPIDAPLLKLYEEQAREWGATIILRLLRAEAESIRKGKYYAWDLLAAMALVRPELLSTRPVYIAVRKRPGERGRLVRVENQPPNTAIATGVAAAEVRKLFEGMLP